VAVDSCHGLHLACRDGTGAARGDGRSHDAQVSAYGNFLVLIMAGISGCLMPRSWQPELMQQIGLITPHAWALIAYDQLLNRELPDLAIVWRCCAVMLAFTAGFFAVGWWRFRSLD